MKLLRKFCLALIIIFAIATSSQTINASDCTQAVGVCAIYDENKKTLKLYGDNSIGQLGISKDTASVSKENAIDINQLLDIRSVEKYVITKDNVFVVSNSDDVYTSGSNKINQMGIKNRKNYYQFIKNPYLSNYLGFYNLTVNTNSDKTTKSIKYVADYYNATISNGILNQTIYKYHPDSSSDPSYSRVYTRAIETGQLLEQKIIKNYHRINYQKYNKRQLFLRTETYKYSNNKITSYSKVYKYVTYTRKKEYNYTFISDSYKRKYKNNTLIYQYRIQRNTNNKVTLKDKYTFNNNKKSHLKIKYQYQKNKKTLKKQYRYVYNSANQLKSNKKGKAYRYTTSYSYRGKAIKTIRQQYKYNGKLAKKAIKTKLIK